MSGLTSSAVQCPRHFISLRPLIYAYRCFDGYDIEPSGEPSATRKQLPIVHGRMPLFHLYALFTISYVAMSLGVEGAVLWENVVSTTKCPITKPATLRLHQATVLLVKQLVISPHELVVVVVEDTLTSC